MGKQGFRQFLKKSGKKVHVIDGLINRVQAFKVYLADKQQNNMEDLSEQNLRDYVKSLPQKEIKGQMRALALYFRFIEKSSLSRLSMDFREQEIAKTRKSFKLREFRGVNLEEIGKLETAGIITVEHMLSAGKTPKARHQLAEQTSISKQTILELVKLSDLSRLGAVKSIRTRLYYDAGIDSPNGTQKI